MKILYINCSRIPTEKAHGLQMMKMCEAFADFGVALELWIPKRLNFIKKDAFDYYGVKRNFTIKKIPCIDFIVIDKLLGPLAFWLTELSFLFIAGFCLLRTKKDCIYTRDKFLGFFLTFFNKNVFYEAHTVPAAVFFSGMKRVRGVIVITRYLKKFFVGRGAAEEKVLVAPDGVDLAGFDIPQTQDDCRRRLGLPLDRKIILYTGHLYPWKGTETLLEAAKQSTTNSQQSPLFLFVGGTKADLQRLSVISCQLSNVKLMGHRSHKEIPYWLKAADVLVLPNSAKYDISKYWTSPIKMFEYMAAGKPIVASDLPSIREVLSENNAIFVEPDCARALVLAIRDLLGEGSNRDAIAARARENAKEYIWSKRAKKILGFIAQRYII